MCETKMINDVWTWVWSKKHKEWQRFNTCPPHSLKEQDVEYWLQLGMFLWWNDQSWNRKRD